MVCKICLRLRADTAKCQWEVACETERRAFERIGVSLEGAGGCFVSNETTGPHGEIKSTKSGYLGSRMKQIGWLRLMSVFYIDLS
jgi:hypothetical protein